MFGSGIKKSEGSTNIFAAFNSENPPQVPTSSIFGTPTSNMFTPKKDAGNSIFSSSLNTTPAATAGDVKASEPFGGGLFGNKTNFSFGGASDNNIFSGSNNKENGEPAAAKPFAPFSSTPVFGSTVFGSSINKPDVVPAPAAVPSQNIFGSGLTSTFSFAEAAKELDKPKDLSAKPVVPDFIQNSNDSGGFAALAATAAPEQTWASGTSNAGGFYGLTVKDDFFSKNLNKANNPEAGDSSQNDENVVNDENYDPHYDPIISLPDEISVSTGEEEEEKMFAERAKLFRYDTKTKEWKERG
jgi:E3 SUMO-protein ligase RanBP2